MPRLSIHKCEGCLKEKSFRIDYKFCSTDCRRKKPDVAFKENLIEKDEIEGDTWVVTIPKTRIKTLEELIEHRQIDLTIWTVKRWVCNQWEMGAKNAAGDLEVEPLYQVKAFLELKKNIVSAKDEIEDLKTLAKEFPWPVSIEDCQYQPSTGLMLEMNLPDSHWGKLAWSVETGGANYDVKIAENIYWEAINTLLDRVSHYKFDQILFVIGNDTLNSDDIEGRTTAGTYVSSDARYHKTFATVRTAMIAVIKRLLLIANVKVVAVYGNHDRLSSWHLADSIDMYFTNDSRVTVDNQPRARKYHKHGQVLLMFTHGDKGKKADYPLTMATEEPLLFGSTKHRECHTGHTHMTKLDEQHGVRVRVLPALCPADDWHSQNFFIGNQRSAEAYVWSATEGLISTAVYTVQEEQ